MWLRYKVVGSPVAGVGQSRASNQTLMTMTVDRRLAREQRQKRYQAMSFESIGNRKECRR